MEYVSEAMPQVPPAAVCALTALPRSPSLTQRS